MVDFAWPAVWHVSWSKLDEAHRNVSAGTATKKLDIPALTLGLLGAGGINAAEMFEEPQERTSGKAVGGMGIGTAAGASYPADQARTGQRQGEDCAPPPTAASPSGARSRSAATARTPRFLTPPWPMPTTDARILRRGLFRPGASDRAVISPSS
ncbi:hypothetical protein [Azotobacter salinestris]|uniref:hypothetical protein n=1 Tax=Azotobacter salinestris TaxID=69964 RepID=UPI001AD68688|nr:hypothetical protein [Azotobacter salinestris]